MWIRFRWSNGGGDGSLNGGSSTPTDQINPPANGNISQVINWLVKNPNKKYNKLFTYDETIDEDIFKNNQLTKDFSTDIDLYNFGKGNFNEFLPEDSTSLNLRVDSSNDIPSEIDRFNVDELIKNYSGSSVDYNYQSYKLFENKISTVHFMIHENKAFEKLYNNLSFYMYKFTDTIDYTNIEIQNLHNSKEKIVNSSNNSENDFLVYKNPNSKKFIFKGNYVGKTFEEAKPDEIFLTNTSKKVTGDTLKDLIDVYSKTMFINNPIEIKNETYYPVFVIYYNSSDMAIGVDITNSKLKYFNVNVTYDDSGLPTNFTFEENTTVPDVNGDYTLIIDNITNKKIITSSQNSSDSVLGVPNYKYTTLTKCHRIKLESKNSSIEDKIESILGLNILLCKDEENNFYYVYDRSYQKHTLEFYNYDAAVEKTEFVKDYIRKNLNIN